MHIEYAQGDEPECLLWMLAGQKYDPVRRLHRWVQTEWKMADAVTHAERRGMKIVPRMSIHYHEEGEKAASHLVAEISREGHEAVMLLESNSSNKLMNLDLLSQDENALYSLASVLLDDAPPFLMVKPDQPDAIQVNFAFGTFGGGNNAVTRTLNAPKWEDIRVNYPKSVRAELDGFIAAGPGTIPGHLGVLHGPVGTGKTSFIRALCRAWAGKAKITYVIDPETFFSSPMYMLNMILSKSGGKWHIIICEDAENFLTRDAREKVPNIGQAMTRVLNVGDGMLGQGLNVMILFTTNASRVEIDPAIIRKGRCFLDAEVSRFTRDEAEEWLANKGLSPEEMSAHLTSKDRSVSLAELYAITGEPLDPGQAKEEEEMGLTLEDLEGF